MNESPFTCHAKTDEKTWLMIEHLKKAAFFSTIRFIARI